MFARLSLPLPRLPSLAGSGKTFTITGLHKLVARDVFRAASADAFAGLGLAVHVSFLEIYGARCVDLLHGRAKVSILEDAKQVRGGRMQDGVNAKYSGRSCS